jgi:hypothetical protein
MKRQERWRIKYKTKRKIYDISNMVDINPTVSIINLM